MGKRLLIAVLLLLLIPVLLAAFLLYSSAGLQLVAQQLPRLQRHGVHIEGVSGALAGPLYVQRFELKHPRVHAIVHDIEIDPQLRGLLLQTLQARSASAREALVELHAVDAPPSGRPPRFLPAFLRIDVRGVTVEQVRYVHLNGTAVEADHVHAGVTVTSRRLRIRDFQVAAPQFDAAGDLRLTAGAPLALHGRAAGRLRLPLAELSLDAQVNGPIDRLAIKGRLQAPQTAALDALFTRTEGEWRLAGDIRSSAVDLGLFLRKPPFSLRNVALQFIAEPGEIRAAGALGVPELHEDDLRIEARGRYADRVLHVASADVALNGAPARVHAAGTVAFTGETPTLDVAAHWTSLQWPLTGDAVLASPSGSGALRGARPYEFQIAAQVEGPQLPDVQGEARGLLSPERLVVDEFQVDALDGSVQGAGALQWSAPRPWTLSATATDLNPGQLHEELPGRISFTARADGAGLNRDALFSLQVDRLSGAVRGERVRASGALRRERQAWSARDVSVSFGAAAASLEGSWGEHIEARWTLKAPSLAQVLPQAAGSLESSGELSGPRNAPRIAGSAQATNLRYAAWSAGRLSIEADLDPANQHTSRLVVDGERIGREQPILGELHVRGEGAASDHRIDVELTGVAPGPRQAPSRASLQVAGSYNERWDATITSARLVQSGREQTPIEIAEPARLTASSELAELENLCFEIGAGRLCGEGRWRRGGAWDAMAAGYEIPLASVLPPSGDEAEYAGRIEGRVRINGAPGQLWQGDAGMRIIDAAVIYRPEGAEPQTLNLGTGGLGATATSERIDFSFGVQAFTDTFLYANARLQRRPGAALVNLPLTADVRARAADANILPLVFPEIDHAAGVLSANASVGGTLALPEINGRIELSNGEFDSYRVNLALRELTVTADLASNGLEFRGEGRAGEGRLRADGRFAWRGGVSRGELTLRGENLLVADLPEYRVVASPDLLFRIEGEQMNVTGDVRIPSAMAQPNQLTGAVRVSDDARYVDEHPAELDGRFVVRSEVRVAMGDDVRVDAFGLQARITGAVLASVQTGKPPAGRGELGVVDGRYSAYGQNLQITRGQLLFDASPLDDPGLDIEARRRIDSSVVGLNVRGTLQAPRLQLFSDPSMPQSQILAWLLTGRSSDALRTSDADAVRSAGDALALQGGGLLASQLGRRIGLDEVGVESSVDSDGEASSALVLGKFLSPRLFISYGISLTESINTLKLRYTLSDRWIFRTEAGEHQSADVEFTVER